MDFSSYRYDESIISSVAKADGFPTTESFLAKYAPETINTLCEAYINRRLQDAYPEAWQTLITIASIVYPHLGKDINLNHLYGNSLEEILQLLTKEKKESNNFSTIPFDYFSQAIRVTRSLMGFGALDEEIKNILHTMIDKEFNEKTKVEKEDLKIISNLISNFEMKI